MTKTPRPPVAPPPPAAFGDRLADFAPLSPAELKLRDACRTGDIADYGDARPETKTEDRLVRAAVLRVFCLGRDPAARVHAHGVRIFGAWIAGALDLAGATVPHPLLCVDCRFDDAITLRDAATRQLIFNRSSCPGITASGLVARSDLFLRALETPGTVSLMGATIGGDLDCAGATFAVGEGDALACDRAEIAGSVFLNGSFTAHREVRFHNATIGGSLDCSGATFAEGRGHALACDGAEIAGSVFLNGGFTAHREIRFHNATIGGSLVCSGATFAEGEGDALACDGAEIAGSVFLGDGFTAHRVVRFHSAIIGNVFDCSGAIFPKGDGPALTCDGADITGAVFLGEGFTAHREVRFLGATIGESLDCSGAIFADGQGDALACDRAEIAGSVFLNGKFIAHRAVRFHNATIGGSLECSGATFAKGQGHALACDHAEIAGSVFLNGKFTAHRAVRFLGATIGGSLECSGATFAKGKGEALDCTRAEIAGAVFLNDGFTTHRAVSFLGATIGGDVGCRKSHFEASAPLVLEKATVTGTLFLDEAFHAAGFVNLASATIGDFTDAPDAWAKPTWILDGLTYRRFVGRAPAEATARIRWLDQQPYDHRHADFRPQPWEQCAKVLAEMGHEADAVRIRIEKRRRMRALPLHRAKTGTKKRRLTAALVHAVRRPGWAATCAVPAALATYGAALLRQGLVRLGIFSDWLLDKSVGYGWRPQWALGWLVLLWGLTAGLYATAVPKGVMAPTDALVYQSRAIPAECKLDWLSFEPPLHGDHDAAQIAAARALGLLGPADAAPPATVPEWKEICARAMPAEYTTFSPWVYALDVLLPIVDLRQEKDWSPRVTDADGDVIAPLFTEADYETLVAWTPDRPLLDRLWTHGPGWVWRNGVLLLQNAVAGWGYLTRLMEWAMILAGWGLSGMLLGAVTGVIRRE